jgi:hypothetical protein
MPILKHFIDLNVGVQTYMKQITLSNWNIELKFETLFINHPSSG